jgi:hypothetical protein
MSKRDTLLLLDDMFQSAFRINNQVQMHKQKITQLK